MRMKVAQQENKEHVVARVQTQSQPSVATQVPELHDMAVTLLNLQRTQGNHFVQRLLNESIAGGMLRAPGQLLGNARLARLFSGSGGPQAQLTVGQPNDPFEQEAEQVAGRVVAGERVARISRLAAGGLQPLTESPPAPSEERAGPPEKTVQGQRQPDLERDGAIQRKAEASEGGIGGDGGQQENKTGLPDHLKAGIENLSGMAMDDVRVHYNSPKPAELDALAYTQGTDIHVAPGQEKHLPHEAWHAVQQKQGQVKPTIQAHEVSINDDPALEREADVMGASAVQMKGGMHDERPDPVAAGFHLRLCYIPRRSRARVGWGELINLESNLR